MGHAWQVTVEIMEIFYKTCIELGAVTREEKEQIFLEIMKQREIEPIAKVDATSAQELADDMRRHGHKVATGEELLKQNKDKEDEND